MSATATVALMRVAAIYDIHGNIDALDAVLKEIEGEDVDCIIVGGDVAWGPFPVEVLARIRSLDMRTELIRGNTDRQIAARADESDGLEAWMAEANVWCADQLTSEDRDFLATLQETVSVSITGLGDVLCCHATPRNDEEIVTPSTPDREVLEVLSTTKERVIVCGHTHSQADHMIGDYRLVNAGSVGLPYEDAPGAYWAILGTDVALKRTEYDVAHAVERIRRSGFPDAERFGDVVGSPPSRASAIEHFEKQRSSSS